MSELQAIAFPQMGVSVTEGTVTVWHKQQGDPVTADDVVCEVSTDKVDTEVLAPADGVLAEIVAAEGETVPVGAPLALLAPVRAEAMAAAATVAAASPHGPTIDITTTPAPWDYAAEGEAAVPVNGRGVLASPVARRLAREHGLDLSAVAGSGRRNRVCKADVLAAIQARVSAPAVAANGSGTATTAPVLHAPAADGGATTAAQAAVVLPPGYDDVPHEVVATSPVRRAIAEHMTRSRHTAAHMTTEVEVDMHRVAAVRAELNAARLADGRGKLTYLPFVARAACVSLGEFPDLNATFEGVRLIRWREVNLGIAVDTDRGLLAPVVRGCERLTVGAIADAIADLAARARARALTPDDMRAGTFTLSNPGSVGAVSAHAIINQPQVAILGTPAIVKRPTVVATADGTETIAIRPIMLLALTFDHRAVDGADATRCAVAIKQRLESWQAVAYT